MKKPLNQFVSAILAASAVFVGLPMARADSPLTSTPIANAYQDVDLVQMAIVNGMSQEVLAALSDPDVPNDVRAAMVNALGWSFDGQNHAETYLDYIASTREQSLAELTIEELTPQETFSLGYLLALDDYFELSAIGGNTPLEQLGALTVLQAAVLKDPSSFSVALVQSLAQAQSLMSRHERWCDVYQRVAAVNDNFVGDRHLRPEATEIVMDYISLYKASCTPEQTIENRGLNP